MTEFEYTNELYDKEIDFIINFISREVRSLKKIKTNITRFAYSEALKGKILFIDFQRCINEVERMAIEIDFLERKKLEYIKIKEKQTKPMTTLSTRVISNFNSSIEKYERTNLTDLLSGSNVTPQKFKQMLINELERNIKLQEAFLKNPASFFASALYCAELNLSPSSLVGEFFFTVHREQVKPILGYKGLVALLLRSDKVKKIWAEVVYNEDDFEYELGLEPKMVHIPNFNSVKTCDNIKCIYACAKVGEEIVFKVMTLEEIKTIVEILETPSEYYFNDKKDPEKWLLKKVALKQMSKLMPKEDDRLLKAVSFDDNVEGGGYLVLDENDTVRVVQGTIIGKHNANKKASIYQNLTNFSEKPLPTENNDLHLSSDTDVTSVSDNVNTKGQ